MSVREQLVALAKLGRIDASTQELDQELKAIPKEVDELRESVGLLEGLLARERSQLAEAEQLNAQHDALLKESADAIARSKAKSAKARNAREAEAVERELESIRRSLKDREAEAQKLVTAIEQVRASLSQHEAEFSGLKEMLATKESEAQARLSTLESQRSEALRGRDEVAAAVPPDILGRYDALRKRRTTGVAEMKDGICMGCRMAVRPMQSIVIQREEGVERCAHCQRFLYWGPWLGEDEAALEAGETDSP